MESTKKNISSGIQPRSKNGKDKCQSCVTNDIQEKMKKVDVKTSSPTSLLAKNTLLLPTGVIKSERVKAKAETMPSSGSATGKIVFFNINIDFSSQLKWGKQCIFFYFVEVLL